MDAARRFRRWMAQAGFGDDDTRATMLSRLRQGGVVDEAVLDAMARVPRQEFVLEGSEGAAYANRALAIGYGQTISQPLIVGILVQAVAPRTGERVLDVGTGSGYQAAVLRACGAQVVSVERIERLAVAARRRLGRLGYGDVEVVVGDGSLGVPEHAPYDAIAVAASAPELPRALIGQLAEGGRLVVPVRRGLDDELVRARRKGDEVVTEDLGPCRFVPLIGEGGYRAE